MAKRKKRYSSLKALILLPMLALCAILCVLYLDASSYAWFEAGVQGGNSVVGVSNDALFYATVYKEGESDPVATVDAKEDVALPAMQGQYTVKLTLPKQSASGYLVISVGGNEYRSPVLTRSDTADQEITFSLQVNDVSDVTLAARWGSYTGACHVQSGETLVLN